MVIKGKTYAQLMALLCLTSIACSLNAQHVVHATRNDKYVAPKSKVVQDKLEWFRDQKLCLMMHFGLYSILGITESWPLVTADSSWARADVEWTKDDAEFKRQYYALNRCFNPVRFDAKGIAGLAKRCGFRYVTFTTKHHDGFCLYDSKFTDYKTTAPDCPYSTNPNADMVKSLFDACRAEGLGIGAYFSKPDFHHTDFWEDFGIGKATSRYPTYDIRKQPEKWARFCEFTKNQILELVSGYGPIDIMWLDGGWLKEEKGHDMGIGEMIDAARAVQPDLISVNRGSKDEYMNIGTPEQSVPGEPLDYPWESCITIGGGWGYHFDETYKSSRELVHLLVDVVAKGGNLALNVGPMPDGRLPRPAVERMVALGAWLSKNGKAIYSTRTVTPCSYKQWRFTRERSGREYAIRLWREHEQGFLCTAIPYIEGRNRVVKRIVHVASGADMEIKTIYDRPGFPEAIARGVLITFPAGFRQDEYADAFAIEYE